MAGLPALAGAAQETDRRVVLSATAETAGVAGASGGSSTSVMLTITPASAVAAPSETLTVTV